MRRHSCRPHLVSAARRGNRGAFFASFAVRWYRARLTVIYSFADPHLSPPWLSAPCASRRYVLLPLHATGIRLLPSSLDVAVRRVCPSRATSHTCGRFFPAALLSPWTRPSFLRCVCESISLFLVDAVTLCPARIADLVVCGTSSVSDRIWHVLYVLAVKT